MKLRMDPSDRRRGETCVAEVRGESRQLVTGGDGRGDETSTDPPPPNFAAQIAHHGSAHIVRCLERAGDAGEGRLQLGADARHGRDNSNGDKRRDQAVLDGRRAGLVTEITLDEITHVEASAQSYTLDRSHLSWIFCCELRDATRVRLTRRKAGGPAATRERRGKAAKNHACSNNQGWSVTLC